MASSSIHVGVDGRISYTLKWYYFVCIWLSKKSIKTNFTCFFWRFHVATRTLRMTYVTCITFMVDSMTLEPRSHISPWGFHKCLKVAHPKLNIIFCSPLPCTLNLSFIELPKCLFFIRLHWEKSGDDLFHKWSLSGCAGSLLPCASHTAFSSCSKQGLFSTAVWGLLIACGFSCGAQGLGTGASVVEVHELSCPVASGIFLDKELNLYPLH